MTAWRRESFGQNGLLGREHRGQVILKRFLLAALQKYNPGLPQKAYEQGVSQVTQKIADKSAGRINKEKYDLLLNGVEVVTPMKRAHVKNQN